MVYNFINDAVLANARDNKKESYMFNILPNTVTWDEAFDYFNPPPIPESFEPPGGVSAGAVIGILFAISVSAAAGIYCYYKKKGLMSRDVLFAKTKKASDDVALMDE